MLSKIVSLKGHNTLILTVLGFLSLPMIGNAQSSTGLSSASLEQGYGNARRMTEQAFNPSTRDAQGNRLVKNGVIITDYTSQFARSQGFGGGPPAQRPVPQPRLWAIISALAWLAIGTRLLCPTIRSIMAMLRRTFSRIIARPAKAPDN